MQHYTYTQQDLTLQVHPNIVNTLTHAQCFVCPGKSKKPEPCDPARCLRGVQQELPVNLSPTLIKSARGRRNACLALATQAYLLVNKTLNLIFNNFIDHLHPNINMHILHTVLYKFPRLLTRRICLTIKSFFTW